MGHPSDICLPQCVTLTMPVLVRLAINLAQQVHVSFRCLSQFTLWTRGQRHQRSTLTLCTHRQVCKQGVQTPMASMQPEFEFLHSNYTRVPWEQDTPELVFLEAQACIRTLSSIRAGTPAHVLLQEQQVMSAASSIYFSNLIEDAGLSFAETYQLYMESLQAKNAGSTSDRPGPSAGSSAPSRTGESGSTSHKEVVQHAAAYAYLAEMMVEQQQPLSKSIIKHAHAILMEGMVREDGLRIAAGQYRNSEAHAGWHMFPPPATLSEAMARLVQQYNSRAGDPSADPFVLAAWLSYELVAIHPFEDGNGRMCRLLLNMALLSHGIPFANALGFSSKHKQAKHKQAKRHYMQCVIHAQQHGGNTRRLAFVVLCAFRDTAKPFLEKLQTEVPSEQLQS